MFCVKNTQNAIDLTFFLRKTYTIVLIPEKNQ